MKAEIVLTYSNPYETYREEVESSSVTEIANMAYSLQKQTNADLVNFNWVGEKHE